MNIIKKVKIATILSSKLLVLSVCQSLEVDNTESIVNDGISEIQPPIGVKVIDNIAEFEEVTDARSYNREIDASTCFFKLMEWMAQMMDKCYM